MDVRGKQSNEKRLIDADALLDEFLKRYTERERNGNLVFAACEIKQDFADMISNVPNVYAVEVVRCMDCKYHEDTSVTGFKHCCLIGKTVRYNDFCSYGKLKEGDDNG